MSVKEFANRIRFGPGEPWMRAVLHEITSIELFNLLADDPAKHPHGVVILVPLFRRPLDSNRLG